MAGNFEGAKRTAVDTARQLGTNRMENRVRQKPGPPRSTVRAKFYYLPDGSEIPTFNPRKELDPKVREHMSQGYGNLFLCYVAFLDDFLCYVTYLKDFFLLPHM